MKALESCGPDSHAAVENVEIAHPKVGFVSLGCPKNLVDSEVMMGLLSKAGATMTADVDTADVLVVNTCSFIDKAKQESVDAILEMARHKADGIGKRLVVAGCMVERYREEIQKNIPEVDAVVGTGELEQILTAAGIAPPANTGSPFRILTSTEAQIAHRPEGNHRQQQGRFSRKEWDGAIADLPNYLYDEHTPRLRTTAHSSAYVKIAEGCDHPCGFCIIPQLRGKFRSRRFESVVAEVEQLVAEGVREVTLIGQDTTCYGEDLGMKDGLAQLLERLAQIQSPADGSGLRWLRFLYAYPNKVTPALLDTMARHETICKYLDVPLQHATPNVLKRMKRGGSAEIFLKMIERARTTMPDITLRTSFIAGFPGETAEDFNTLHDFVSEARFDWMGVFEYSDEEGSAAYALDGKVPRRTIAARQRKLMRSQRQISRKARKGDIGRSMEILVEGESEETPLLWQGRAAMHAPEIDGKILINDFGPHTQLKAGNFYRCEITEAHDYDLVARIL